MTRVSLQRSSDALHAPRRSPPLPPLRKGGKGDDHLRKEGKVGGVWSFFPPLRRGGRGGVLKIRRPGATEFPPGLLRFLACSRP